jgi:uncharacterized protein YbjT (DUF2867 family)
MTRHALVAGSTGLIGSQLLRRLLADARFDRVSVLVRRPLAQAHPKLTAIVTDFDDLESLGSALQADDVFCCLGTTRAKAGSKQAFEAVDYELVMRLARATKAAGSRQFLVVSALGANVGSMAFYSQVKGRVERDLRTVGFASLHIFRPSLLLGERAESRRLEGLGQRLAPVIGGLLPARYKPIEADTVAAALLQAAVSERSGTHVHEAPFATG